MVSNLFEISSLWINVSNFLFNLIHCCINEIFIGYVGAQKCFDYSHIIKIVFNFAPAKNMSALSFQFRAFNICHIVAVSHTLNIDARCNRL